MREKATSKLDELLAGLEKSLRVAKKNRVSLASHSFYSVKIRSTLAQLRKSFLSLKHDNPPERYPAAAYQIATIEPLIQKLVAMYPSDPGEILAVLHELQFKAASDLAAELDPRAGTPAATSPAP